MCASIGGGDGAPAAKAEGVEELVAELLQRVPPRLRRLAGPLLFAIDHCFAIRGQGTVLTGTVLRVRLADSVRRLEYEHKMVIVPWSAGTGAEKHGVLVCRVV